MSFDLQCTISNDHPSLAGHFPGDPIVPGVVILEEVMNTIYKWKGECRISQLKTVKFLAPIKPGQSFSINLAEPKPQLIKFTCTASDVVLVSGNFVCQQ